MLKERDIAGGNFTYGERIMLVRILTNDSLTDYEKTKQVIEVLHDTTLQPQELAFYAPYVAKVVQSINEWLKREQSECFVPPTPEQMQAGVEKFAEECGDMGGVVALAESRGWTFKQVLEMPYTDIFTIWKVEAAREKFDRRLSEQMKRNSKGHGRHS